MYFVKKLISIFLQVQRRQVQSHLQISTGHHLSLACLRLYDTELRLRNTEVELSKIQETNMKLMDKVEKLEYDASKRKNEPPVFPKVFVWKIINFSEILTQAQTGETTAVEYGPFFTSNYGYKLKVNMYPNGSGPGRNTHLSLYIVVMQGEYDAILPWPFREKVKFTLIDQQEDPEARKNVSNWILPLRNAQKNFARPVSKENVGRGFPKFISHETLSSRRYVVDDALFLEVEVGLPCD